MFVYHNTNCINIDIDIDIDIDIIGVFELYKWCLWYL